LAKCQFWPWPNKGRPITSLIRIDKVFVKKLLQNRLLSDPPTPPINTRKK